MMKIKINRVSPCLFFLVVCSMMLFNSSGSIAQNAPVTTLATIGDAMPGQVAVPLTVINFTNIGACSLCFDYQYAGLHYVQGNPNPALAGFSTGDQDLGNGKHLVTMGWFGSGISLPDGSVIVTVIFNYISGISALEFYDMGPSCEYTDPSGNKLIDTPTAYYYKNGSISPPLIANFSAGNLTPPKNTTVQFNDLSTGGATSWDWSFDRTVSYQTPTNSHSQNPQVQFTDGGLYTVTLVVHTSYLTDSEIKAGYVRAGISGVWTGNTSSDWTLWSNWENWLIPGSSTDVVIPPTASFWPVFDGNLFLGTNCHNLTLSGATSKMTITGNLTIP